MTESQSTRAPQRVSDDNSDGLLAVLVSLLRHRALLFGVPLGLFLLVLGKGLLSTRTYTAHFSFIPSASSGSLGQVASLAAQFGVALPASSAAASSDFYVDLIRSGQVLRAVVRTHYAVPDGDDALEGTLVDFYDINEPTDGRRVAKAANRLRRSTSVRADPKTTIVKVDVKADYADLALQVAEAVLAEVNRFDLHSRQSQAGQERVFIEARLAESRDSLLAAEALMAAFLEANREFRNSPALAFEHDRLQRIVLMEQQVVTSLNQGYEQAQIEEVRNTQVVTVVESPILPPKPDSRFLLLKGVIALLVGLSLAVMAGIVARFSGTLKEEDPATSEAFSEVLAGLRRDARRPWRLLRRDSAKDAAVS